MKENELEFSFNPRKRLGKRTLPELLTLRIAFQMSQVQNFKRFVLRVKTFETKAFPTLNSYERWVLWLPRMEESMRELMGFLLSTADGLNAIDSTALPLLKFKHKGKGWPAMRP